MKNVTEDVLDEINVTGIKNKKNITYIKDNVKTKILFRGESVILVRENNDFMNIIPFNTDKMTVSEYNIKDKDLVLEINVYTKKILLDDSKIEITYVVQDSNTEYLYRIDVDNLDGK